VVRPAAVSPGTTDAGGVSETPLLEVDDLHVRFPTPEGTVFAVNGISLFLDVGETLGLVGESGSGKSVTSLALMRLLPPPPAAQVQGRIRIGDRDIARLSERQMQAVRGRDMAMVFQDPMTSLNPVLRIGEQIEETIRAHRRIDAPAARARAGELLGLVGIPDATRQLDRYPHEFSGGMRQRVMIAIALALEPALLIADEPTTALDVTIQAQVLELLHELTARIGTAVLLITHDLGVVARMTRRVGVMYAGTIVEAATTAELFATPKHPYTVGLLRSIARVDDDEALLHPIEGSPPDLREIAPGCPFAPRCAWRLERCWNTPPPLRPLDARVSRRAEHLVACHNPVLATEVASARPERAGFVAAPPPGDAR
jgi:oligopeptide/dipeptide ABC transporter ATP-binding protein